MIATLDRTPVGLPGCWAGGLLALLIALSLWLALTVALIGVRR